MCITIILKLIRNLNTLDHKEVNQTHLQESNTLDDNKSKDEPENNDDAFKNSSSSIRLTAISNDPRIRGFSQNIQRGGYLLQKE